MRWIETLNFKNSNFLNFFINSQRWLDPNIRTFKHSWPSFKSHITTPIRLDWFGKFFDFFTQSKNQTSLFCKFNVRPSINWRSAYLRQIHILELYRMRRQSSQNDCCLTEILSSKPIKTPNFPLMAYIWAVKSWCQDKSIPL